MGRPLFNRVLLRVETVKEKPLFGEETKKPRVWIEDVASNCDSVILENIGAEVIFNGVVGEVVQEDKDYKWVITHETNLLQLV